MNIAQLMNTKIVMVNMDDSLNVIKEIFDNVRFHHLLVIEEEILMGVISDRDLLKSISPHIGTSGETSRDLATLKKKAHQIMTRAPVTLSPEAEVLDAIRIFNTHNFSCIPVIDSDNKPVGIVSWRDILRVIESNWSETPGQANTR